MAYVREEINFHGSEDVSVNIQVLEQEKGEYGNPWRAVRLEVDTFDNSFTSKELKKFGEWLIKEADRIGKEYNKNGSKKQP